MTGVIAAQLGVEPSPSAAPRTRADRPRSAGSSPSSRPAAIELLDVSVTADAVDAGAWLDPGSTMTSHAPPLDGWADAAVLPWRTPRLTASRIHASTSLRHRPDRHRRVVRRTPAAGVTGRRRRGRLGAGRSSWRSTPDCGSRSTARSTTAGAGTRVAAGDGLGVVAPGARVRIRLLRAGAPPVPHLVRPEYADGWLALAADPAPLLGLEPLERRRGIRRSTLQQRPPRPPTPPPSSSGATAASPRCRSTTTTPRLASSAAGAST